MSAPAAWLADPTGRHQLRYWNGSAWTDYVSDAGQQSTDPVSGGGAPQQQQGGNWTDKVAGWGQQAAAATSSAVDSAADAWNRQGQANAAAAPAATPAQPAPSPATAANAAETSSIADQLHKLAELRDRGVLTDEEFQAQKARILNS